MSLLLSALLQRVSSEVASYGILGNYRKEENSLVFKLEQRGGSLSTEELFDWKVCRWSPTNCSHQGLSFEAIRCSQSKQNEGNFRRFTVELILCSNKKIVPYYYIEDKMSRHPISRQIEDLSENTSAEIVVKSKSIEDIETIARECISHWHSYSLLFFNCRHFVNRMRYVLQGKNPDRENAKWFAISFVISLVVLVLLQKIDYYISDNNDGSASLIVMFLTIRVLSISLWVYFSMQYWHKEYSSSKVFVFAWKTFLVLSSIWLFLRLFFQIFAVDMQTLYDQPMYSIIADEGSPVDSSNDLQHFSIYSIKDLK